METKIINDGKEKRQSFEFHSEGYLWEPMFHCTVSIDSYGEDLAESKLNAITAVQKLILKLQKFQDTIPPLELGESHVSED